MTNTAVPFVALIEGEAVFPLNVLAVTRLVDGRVFIAVERTSSKAEDISSFMLATTELITGLPPSH